MVYIRFCNVTWPFVRGYAISNQHVVVCARLRDFESTRGRSYTATRSRESTSAAVRDPASLHVAIRTRLRYPASLHVVIRTRLFELR